MRSFKANFRLLAFVAPLLAFAIAPQDSRAQTVSVSPGDLSYGVPTQTPFPTTGLPLASAPDSVTVIISGSGPVTFSGTTVGAPGSNPGDFVVDGNSCTGTIASPSTCQVTLHFNASLAPASTLETATLTVNFTIGSSPGRLTVPMNGAYGAIKLFSALDINPSLFPGVTWPNSAGNPVNTVPVNLSCPANPTAVLSSTPDGSGNVFQDNTIQIADTIAGSTLTTSNVCYGGDTNFQGFTGFPAGTSNCFQQSYESAASGFLGQNPDLAGVPANYGVQPLNLMNAVFPPGTPPLYSPVLQSGPQSLSVQLIDAGGDLGAATLHLVTNCSLAGVTPGGTITGNPINPSNPSSLSQTYTLDSGPGQNISIVDNDAQSPPPPGAVPSITDIGVPQSLFSQLVAGSSAAPAVCLRMAGEVDSLGNPMCKGFLIECTSGGTTSGSNCDPTNPNTARNLYDALQFASPDGPVNGFNFLYGPVGSPAADACSNILTGLPSAACATGTGPGILMGSDNWLCAPGQTAPCTPLEPNTATPPSPATYSAGNCDLTGSVAGDLCPLDTLTQFKGAADVLPGGTTSGKNSILIPVVNMPLPSTTFTSSFQSNGWTQAPNPASVTFTANPATYSPGAINPPTNGFVAAPAYAVTYGVTPAASPLPDTTYPIPSDTTLFNPRANPNFGAPLCSPSTTPSFSAPPVNLTTSGDGIYNLHFFTTDCALTEELVFNPQGSQLTDPTANWASFRYVTFGVDTVAPTFSCSSPNTSVWYNMNQTVSCTVTDQDYVANVSGSGFLPLVSGIQGSQSETVSVSTSVPANNVNSAAPTNSLQACDLAGNCVSVSAGPFKIDLQPPTITGPTLNPAAPYYLNGPPVTVTYACSDGLGSGVASCIGTETLPGGGTVNTSSGGTISTSTAGNYSFTVTATDNAGNQSTSSVPFSVSAAPAADLAIVELPVTDSIERGKTGHYYAGVINLSSPTANNVVITSTYTVPNNILNGSLSGSYALVSCSLTGCSVPSSGTSCSVTTTVGASTTVAVLTCNVGQLVSISKLKGEVLAVNIPVLSTAAVNTKFSSVTTVTSDNDPKLSNNTVSESYTVTK
ncbi:MAG: hypothetical protein WCD47_07460 [Candidatus Sulfotelmatobacter sp.]